MGAIILNQNHVLAIVVAFLLLIYGIVPPVERVRIVEVERDPIVIVEPDPVAMRCLARIVYGEARSDTAEGQRAVAWVALNRTVDGRWPSSVCGVALQKGQFSLAPRTLVEPNAWEAALTVARLVLTERHAGAQDLTAGAVFFALAKPGKPLPWTHGPGLTIGQHTFWR